MKTDTDNQLEMFNTDIDTTFVTGKSVAQKCHVVPSRTVLGNFVATERIKTTQVQTTKTAGLAMVANKSALDRLEVRFDSECIAGLKRGHHVYIRQNQYNSGWATAVYTLDDQEFILIPREALVLVEFN